MTENEKAEYTLREKAEWAAIQASIVAWLGGEFDEEIRLLQAVEYAGDLPVESEIDWEMIEEEDEGEMPEVEGFTISRSDFLYSSHLPAMQSIEEHVDLLLLGLILISGIRHSELPFNVSPVRTADAEEWTDLMNVCFDLAIEKFAWWEGQVRVDAVMPHGGLAAAHNATKAAEENVTTSGLQSLLMTDQ